MHHSQTTKENSTITIPIHILNNTPAENVDTNFLKKRMEVVGVVGMQKIKDRLDLAIDWLNNSGIVNPDGGVYCWYDMEKDEYPFIYPEITAYTVSTFLYLGQLEKAVKSGKWLMNNAQYIGTDKSAEGGFFWKVQHPVYFKSKFLYSFDTGICISGLVELFSKTKERKFLDSAVMAGNWLVNVMQNKDGSFKPFYNLTTKDRYLIDDKWSRKPGPFHSKIAIGLLKLYDITRNEKLRISVKKLCDWTAEQDILTGKTVYLHDLCYATEGLLYTSQKLETQKPQNWEMTSVWYASKIADAQGPDGGIGRWLKDGTVTVDQNTEATAQAVRLWIILSQMYPEDEFFHKNIERGIDYLLSKQNLSGVCEDCRPIYTCYTECPFLEVVNPKANGGFYYAVVDGKLLPHINTCATLFSIQALQMYVDWKSEKLVEPLKWLV